MAELKPILDWVGGLGGTAVICLVAWAVWSGRLLLPRERDSLLKQIEEEKARTAKAEAEGKERATEWKATAARNMEAGDKAAEAIESLAAAMKSRTPGGGQS